MKVIPVSNLSAGRKFTEAMYLTWGQKFLAAGTELKSRHIQWLRQWGQSQVVLASDLGELVQAGLLEPFDTGCLRAGERAPGPILSAAGWLVLEAEQEIEPHHLRALARGRQAFRGTAAAASWIQATVDWGQRLAAELEKKVGGPALRVQPAMEPGPAPETLVQSGPDRQKLAAVRQQGLERLRELWTRIEAGLTVAVEDFQAVTEPLAQMLENDPRWFAQLALSPPCMEDYLPDHAYTTAVLAMAVAARLRWPGEHVMNLGLAGLLADIGMLLLPAPLRLSEEKLGDVERELVHQHPYLSLVMLERVPEASPRVQLAVLQHQEREGGQGYPRGLSGTAVSDYARVLSVADTFAAAIGLRPYRQPVLPYIAMEQLLCGAVRRLFWRPAAQALMQVYGLFPVGSYVKLSDGREACVLASHFQKPNRPLVEVLDEVGRPTGHLIDLAEPVNGKLTIVRALAGPRQSWAARTEAA